MVWSEVGYLVPRAKLTVWCGVRWGRVWCDGGGTVPECTGGA